MVWIACIVVLQLGILIFQLLLASSDIKEIVRVQHLDSQKQIAIHDELQRMYLLLKFN